MKKFLSTSHLLQLVLLAIAGLGQHATVAAAECPWLAADVLDAAMPQYRPWTVDPSSGAGRCRFEGEASREPGIRYEMPMLSLTQQVKPNPDAAAGFAKHLKQAMAKDYVIEPTPMLGKEAFSYAAGPDAQMVSWVAHEGSQVLMVAFVHREPVKAEDRAQVQAIAVRAMKNSADPAAAKAALSCPYFDEPLLKKLLPGPGLKVQRFGADSCMANTDDAVVMLVRSATDTESEVPALLKRRTPNDAGCVSTPEPDVSPYASLVYGCAGGNASARIWFNKGRIVFNIDLVPEGKAPTPAQHQQLLALARAAVNNPAAK
ncbi:MAG: hypothetical protein JWP29_3370 [Rhodoferax sp.]|nr:hypothetical protein [Rhodoferax sp.]